MQPSGRPGYGYLLNCYNVDIDGISFNHTDSAYANHSCNIYIKGSGHIHNLRNFDGRGNLVRAFAGGIRDPAHGIITDQRNSNRQLG